MHDGRTSVSADLMFAVLLVWSQEAKLKAKKAEAWRERLKTQAATQQNKQQKWVTRHRLWGGLL